MTDDSPAPAESPSSETSVPSISSGRAAHGGRGFAAGLAGGAVAALLLMGGLGTAGWPLLKSRLLAAEQARLNDLEQRLAALESHPANAAGTESALAQRVAALESRLTGGPAAGEGHGAENRGAENRGAENRADRNAADIARLTGEVDTLRRAIPPEGTILRLAERAEQAERVARDIASRHQSAEALLLVTGELREAVDRGDSYQAELNAARRLSPPAAATVLDSLTPWAASGIPRQSHLAETFPRQADEIIRSAVLPEDETFQSRLWRKLAALVSLRRVDGEGNDTAAIVARAERGVKDGDLPRALRELQHLEDGPARSAAPWLQAAEARVSADRALSELASIALSATAQAEPEPAKAPPAAAGKAGNSGG